MKILVTGGAGFIGSHTVRRLQAEGHRLRVVDDLSAGRRENLPPDVELRVMDVLDEAALRAAMEGQDACLHLAAQVSVQRSLQQPLASANRNILGFVAVLEAARHAGVGRVVHASSAAVYGDAAQLPISESQPPAPLSPYGLEKLVNEQYAALYRRTYGMRVLGLRYFNVFGPGQSPDSPYAGVIARFIDGCRSSEGVQLFGDGLQSRDFIHVEDVARANALALAGDACGVLNIARGQSVSLLDILAGLDGLCGRPVERRQLPERAGDIRHSLAAVTQAEAVLGFRAGIGFAEGLARTWQAATGPESGA